MFKRIRRLLEQIAPQERCPKKLAFAASLAIYIAFSPFIGFHTLMHIVLGWLFGVNIPLCLAVGYGVNNPWTMVPIYMSGYLFGYWLLHSWWGLSISAVNPAWMFWINTQLTYYLGIVDVSFWAFMIGANIVGITLALITYPLFHSLFSRLVSNASY